MKTRFADLWRPGGTIARGPYAVVGILAFAIKHNLDRIVAFGFHRPWSLFNYWVPIREVAHITRLTGNEAIFLDTMLVLAFPFIWLGVTLTLKRLRSAALPPPLVVLFFFPFLNLLFFLVLCVLPERDTSVQALAKPQAERRSFVSMLPENVVGSAAVSLLFTVPIGLALVWLGVRVLTNYGWGLFVAVPFTMGFGAALIYGARQFRTLGSCVGVACLSVAILGAALVGVAIEGVFCLIMAAPLALPLAAFGGSCGYVVQRRRWFPDGAPAFLAALVLLAPGVQLLEHAAAPLPPTFIVRSAIVIDAPPERVWREVVAFTEIPPPKELLFRAGIAYPIRAEMIGHGVGAERHCVFSTGAFVEPIQVWDEPRRLKFSVTSNPAPMQEWTLYSRIDPPHLHGYLESNGGQFLLTPLPNGQTRLEGTTWYHHGLWPATYWRLWSDVIIHQIHMRVLTHIRDEAEK